MYSVEFNKQLQWLIQPWEKIWAVAAPSPSLHPILHMGGGGGWNQPPGVMVSHYKIITAAWGPYKPAWASWLGEDVNMMDLLHHLSIIISAQISSQEYIYTFVDIQYV